LYEAPVPKAELFGRDEDGGQHFHRLLDRLLTAEDGELDAVIRAR
jgi:hypothetical protein